MEKTVSCYGEKLDLFRRGSFHMLTSLLLFSVAFTHWYTEKVVLFALCATIIMINSLGVEYYFIRKYETAPPQYILKFLALALPFAIAVLVLFYSL